MSNHLLPDIESFLSREGMSPTAFSEKATRDRHFVRQLRAGRRVWPETEERVRTFMAEYRPTPTSSEGIAA